MNSQREIAGLTVHRSALTDLWQYIEDAENCWVEVDCGLCPQDIPPRLHAACAAAFLWATAENEEILTERREREGRENSRYTGWLSRLYDEDAEHIRNYYASVGA